MARPTQAIINLQHIKDNYQLAKGNSTSAYAVIKANAYGHGLTSVAKALSGADGFAVACLEEALQLREQGITQAILVLGGGIDLSEWEAALEHDIEMVLHHPHQLATLKKDPRFSRLKLWLKVDTGMNRLGFRLAEAENIFKQCRDTGLNIKALMSHFACADDVDETKTDDQFNALKPIYEQQLLHWPSLIISSNNSAAVLSWPKIIDHISRPGIMLYGSSPYISHSPIDQQSRSLLKPVMTLKSKIVSTHWVNSGESVGYGATQVVTRKTRVGIIAIGYGDGYPRSAPTGTPVWCNGKRLKILGRVSMDMLCVDITSDQQSDLTNIEVGTEVELWGENLCANEIADLCQTISYELFCQLTPRVKRVYINP